MKTHIGKKSASSNSKMLTNQWGNPQESDDMSLIFSLVGRVRVPLFHLNGNCTFRLEKVCVKLASIISFSKLMRL